MSYDDDDDIVVAQTCGTRGCCSQIDLVFDVEEGESYCGRCRELAARVETEGFHIVLTNEERQLVKMIFDAFSHKKALWGPSEFREFAEAVGEHADAGDSLDDLVSYFKEEFDIALDGGVSLVNLESMYGGYKFNNNPALDRDLDILSENGILRLDVLE